MRAMTLSVVGSLAFVASAGIATAQEVYVVEEDDAYVEYPDAAEYPDDYAVSGVVVRPRVYGWIPPDECGEFRYWNGDDCVDARYDADDVDD